MKISEADWINHVILVLQSTGA